MLYIVLWLLCGFAAGYIYRNKGRSWGAAFLVGLLLGPIGILLAAITPADKAGQERVAISGGQMKKCPKCAELVKVDAQVCRFCGYQFVAAPAPVVPEGKAAKQSAPGGTTCSACGGYVRSDATFCKHCKRDFVAA